MKNGHNKRPARTVQARCLAPTGDPWAEVEAFGAPLVFQHGNLRIEHSAAGMGAAEGIPYQADITKIVRSFNAGAAFTAAGALPMLAAARKFATTFDTSARSASLDVIRAALGATPGEIREQIRRDLAKGIAQLDYLAKLLKGKGAAPYKFTASHKTFQDVKQAILVPYFLAGRWRQNIADSDANTADLLGQLAKNLHDIPATIIGGAINYVGDQARKLAPTVPWWFWIAGLGVAGLAVAPAIAGALGATRRAYRRD